MRGPFVRLEPHVDSCGDVRELEELVARLRTEDPQRLLAADLFSGAGGLSLGLEQAGLRVVLGVDHDPEATETHRHHFAGLTVDDDLADQSKVDEIAGLIRSLRLDVVVGGPPCQPFSRAGRSKIRHRVRLGLAEPHDRRRDLWESFLAIVRQAGPGCVLMENVPDMALDREMFIFRTIVHTLEELGYTVEARLVETSRYGVPQSRQRLVIAAMRAPMRFRWPDDTGRRVTVWNAIGDLPEVDGGWRPAGGAAGWSEYSPVHQTTFQRDMRTGVPAAEAGRVYDHITRPVRPDDLQAFELMDERTLYSDLPDNVKRYRDDIFDDKYKRLGENDLSRTITAHIAKDGYWYIHPRQSRTLTIREAARLQTFPDHVRFAGPPSAAFRQIGNAVPPRLGEHLGQALVRSMTVPVASRPTTIELAGRLKAWFDSQGAAGLPLPWLAATTRWQVVVGEILFGRVAADRIRLLWPLFARWQDPAATIEAEADFLRASGWIGREHRAEQLLDAADWLTKNPDALDAPDPTGKIPHVTASVLDLAVLTVPSVDIDASPEPVLVGRGVLRLAARHDGSDVDHRNRMSDGRLAVARLIGGPGTAREAHLALVALASSMCRPNAPRCTECPLTTTCQRSTGAGTGAEAPMTSSSTGRTGA
ncbi:DNA (cytosine-5-)-methyltransferase [Parafrankia colletiae]|uniref:Cytosine-specific methyltransferase n=1 Tax=Parafrankia colletiae TaxID=573497 RepID=A0A1S1Q8K4_9ACTN|nr:DNA cytosine methyltransferase [Parafrankia colletiae]OHV31173.1 DNA (cytosine-5-)-methyltransferase [Parafrankia colletiae]